MNRNQNLLGKTMLVLTRHAVQVVELSAEEWTELREQVSELTARIEAAFAPDRFNYAFLQNVDPHVHLHVIPRYGSSRTVAGERFCDPGFPAHYAVPAVEHRPSEKTMNSIVEALSR